MKKIRDPMLKFLFIKTDKEDRKDHNTAVAVIASALSRSKIDINYDHIDATIMKNRDIPLSVHGKKKTSKADLAFWLRNDILVHVHVDIFKPGQFLTNMDIKDMQHAKKEK